MATQDNTQIIRTLYDAINKHDLERAVSCFHTNGEFKNIGFDKTFRGPAELREMIQSWYRAFPDLALEISNVFGNGDWAVAELFVNGTQKGTFSTPQGEIPPSNQRVHAPSCDVVKIKDGKILSLGCYLETGSLMRQMGMKPMKAAA